MPQCFYICTLSSKLYVFLRYFEMPNSYEEGSFPFYGLCDATMFLYLYIKLKTVMIFVMLNSYQEGSFPYYGLCDGTTVFIFVL